MAEYLDKPAVLFDKDGTRKELPITWLDFLIERTFINAARGNGTALREVLDRVDGKVRADISLEGELGLKVDPEEAREQLARHLEEIADAPEVGARQH